MAPHTSLLPLVNPSPVRVKRSNRVASALITSSSELERKQEGTFRLWKPRKYEGFLIVLFLLTVPLSNPWVRGDGVGYYAYIHALLIHRDLSFETEWRAGNTSFTMA